jgi:hypothetical protein
VGERKKPDYGFGFCRECGAQYKRGGSGAKYCAAHRAAHREELAAKTRAYYAEHREEIVAKKRARRQIAGLLKLMVAADAARRVMDVQQQQTKG